MNCGLSIYDKPVSKPRRVLEELCEQVVGTAEDQEAFLQQLRDLCEHYNKNAYYYCVSNNNVHEKFLEAVEEMGYTLAPYSCLCNDHNWHHILFVPNPEDGSTAVNFIKKKTYDKGGKQRRLGVNGRRIKSAREFVNRVLYIQSAKTRGIHLGSPIESEHSNHGFGLVIPNREVMLAFKQARIFPAIPEIGPTKSKCRDLATEIEEEIQMAKKYRY